VLIAATSSQCYSRCGQQQCTYSSGSYGLKVEVEVEEQTGDVGDRRGQAHGPHWQLHRATYWPLATRHHQLHTVNRITRFHDIIDTSRTASSTDSGNAVPSLNGAEGSAILLLQSPQTRPPHHITIQPKKCSPTTTIFLYLFHLRALGTSGEDDVVDA
jgi:hypothetical protein